MQGSSDGGLNKGCDRGDKKERYNRKKRENTGLVIDEIWGKEGWINICDKQGNDFKTMLSLSLFGKKIWRKWFEDLSLSTERRII